MDGEEKSPIFAIQSLDTELYLTKGDINNETQTSVITLQQYNSGNIKQQFVIKKLEGLEGT